MYLGRHKNLDTHNIYLTRNGLKIGGYEFCDLVEQTKMGEAKLQSYLQGTRVFYSLSPEIIFNTICNSKTTLYGIGIVLYKLFMKGEYPIRALNLKELEMMFTSREYRVTLKKHKKIIPKPFRRAIENLLEFQIHNRLSPAEAKAIINNLYPSVIFDSEADHSSREHLYTNKQRENMYIKLRTSQQLSLQKKASLQNVLELKRKLVPIVSPFDKRVPSKLAGIPRHAQFNNLNKRIHNTSMGILKTFPSNPSENPKKVPSIIKTDHLNVSLVDLRHISPKSGLSSKKLNPLFSPMLGNGNNSVNSEKFLTSPNFEF